jgi:hypothetical protein
VNSSNKVTGRFLTYTSKSDGIILTLLRSGSGVLCAVIVGVNPSVFIFTKYILPRTPYLQFFLILLSLGYSAV